MNCDSAGFLLQDVLFLIGMKGETGELVLESGNNIGSIIFYNGDVLQAYSPYSRAIGDILVERGAITENDLLQALEKQKKSAASTPLGAVFIESGKVSFRVIEKLVQTQICDSIREFLTWNRLCMRFVPKQITPFDSIHLPVHEFITHDTLRSAGIFLLKNPASRESGQTAFPTV